MAPLGNTSSEHPQTALLVIEVASSSVRKDREIKRRLYAAAEIPEYWLVNLSDRHIEVFRNPAAGDYRESSTHAPGSSIRPLAFEDVEIDVATILG